MANFHSEKQLFVCYAQMCLLLLWRRFLLTDDSKVSLTPCRFSVPQAPSVTLARATPSSRRKAYGDELLCRKITSYESQPPQSPTATAPLFTDVRRAVERHLKRDIRTVAVALCPCDRRVAVDQFFKAHGDCCIIRQIQRCILRERWERRHRQDHGETQQQSPYFFLQSFPRRRGCTTAPFYSCLKYNNPVFRL